MGTDTRVEFKICHGCLSLDRKTFICDTQVLSNILGSDNMEYVVSSNNEVRFCWECTATVRRLQEFRSRLLEAQNRLLNILYPLDTKDSDEKSLSKLGITRKYNYDTVITHESNDNKYNNSNLHEDNETKSIKLNLNNDNLNPRNDITNRRHLKRSCCNKVVKADVHNDKISKKEKNNKRDHFNDLLVENDTKALTNSENRFNDTKDNDILNQPNDLITHINDKLTQSDDLDDRVQIKEETIKTEDDYDDDFVDDDFDIEELDEIEQKKAKKKKFRPAPVFYVRIGSNSSINLDDIDNYFERLYLSHREIESLVVPKDMTTRYKPIKCSLCNFICKKKDIMAMHKDITHYDKNPTFSCSKCRRKLSSLDSLKEHWTMGHQVYFRCKLCNGIVLSSVTRRHIKYEHCDIYKCVLCEKTFQSKLQCDVHHKEYHTKFICDYCGVDKPSKRLLEKHIQYAHNTKCNLCNKTFKRYGGLKNHMLTYHPETLNVKEEKELSYCVECDVQYQSARRYKLHLRNSIKHFGNRPKQSEPCPICNKTFSKNIYLKNHYNKMHMGQTKHHCSMCDKYYVNAWGLKIHNENIHLKIPKKKDKICDLCGRGFSSNKILTHHIRTHTGERPYKCPHCSATFAQKYAMVTHTKSQHKDTIANIIT